MRFVCVDWGNSRVKLGLFQQSTGGADTASIEQLASCVVDRTCVELPFERLSEGLASDPSIGGIAAASDPAGLERLAAEWPRKWQSPRVISQYGQLPLDVRVDFPSRVGIDRLLNAVAAARIRDEPASVIVVDAGTATTVDLVAPDGGFEGGAILPGLELSAHALHDYTAKLPLVSLAELEDTPVVPAKETHAAICSGLLFGQLGAIREVSQRLQEAVGIGQEAHVFLTGGAAGLLSRFMPNAIVRSNMPMWGLAHTYVESHRRQVQ